MHCLGGPHLDLMSCPRRESCNFLCLQCKRLVEGQNLSFQSYMPAWFGFLAVEVLYTY